MDIDTHAKRSTDIRKAAEYARGLSDNLHKINNGPVYDADRRKIIEEVNMWLSALNRLLGKEAA
ncbi:MAG: hypothetical protein DI604_31155 [Delftia acidovorans]|nr:MAG: hypothetical protein DI604_31155 [Delftia acidovorans]